MEQSRVMYINKKENKKVKIPFEIAFCKKSSSIKIDLEKW